MIALFSDVQVHLVPYLLCEELLSASVGIDGLEGGEAHQNGTVDVASMPWADHLF